MLILNEAHLGHSDHDNVAARLWNGGGDKGKVESESELAPLYSAVPCHRLPTCKIGVGELYTRVWGWRPVAS